MIWCVICVIYGVVYARILEEAKCIYIRPHPLECSHGLSLPLRIPLKLALTDKKRLELESLDAGDTQNEMSAPVFVRKR